jgi:hypothetical protein
VSPENTFVAPDGSKSQICMGPAHDQQVIWQLFKNYIDASNALGLNDSMLQKVILAQDKLAKPKIGSDGRLMEWNEEFEEVEPGHRHISHLFALHPGYQIDIQKTPDLALAAKKSLDFRIQNGGGHTGWSAAWLISQYARLGESEKAKQSLNTVLSKSTSPNLFGLHPPFQMDANFGTTEGIAEMLIQSQSGEIRLLPALPEEWKTGEVRGLCARGGFVVDMKWDLGVLYYVNVYSSKGGICKLNYKGKKIVFETQPEMNYSPDPGKNGWISPGKTTYYIDPEKGSDDNSGLGEDRSWRTFGYINQLQLSAGDRVKVINPGSFTQSLMLTGEGKVDDPIEVQFAPGRYDFFTDNMFREKYNISNTNDSPDSLKVVGILLKHAKNMKISGKGAEIVCRGKMIEVCVDSCENISISGLSFDYHRPTVSEFEVVNAGKGYADIRIHKDSKYRIEDGKIIWYGEGWISNTRILAQELNPESNDVKRLWDPLEGMSFQEIQPGLVKVSGEHKMKTGHIYQLREIFRDYAAVFIHRSKNILWEKVNFHFLHGMGVVCQFSENLTFDSVSIAPDSTSGRTTAAWADCLHISGCKGKILVKDCIFKGSHDDALNIHGTYLQVAEKVSDKELKVRFMHKQTYGFLAVNPGDEIDFIDSESYKSHGMNIIKSAELINPKEILVTLEHSIPDELDTLDVVENVTWTPEVEIRGCEVSWIPTSGFLISTRRKVLVEENEFVSTHLYAMAMAIDANNWFESGAVRDLTIRKNKFIRCGEPVILIEPGNSIANNAVYQNIRIENNEFILQDESVVKAKSINNLVVSGNTVYAGKSLDDKTSIRTEDCTKVTTAQNRYLPLPE